jgi:hypothetical protein
MPYRPTALDDFVRRAPEVAVNIRAAACNLTDLWLR